MERREDEHSTELCALCGEEVDLMDPSAGLRITGRALCRTCSQRLGGTYDPQGEVWSKLPKLPEPLRPRED